MSHTENEVFNLAFFGPVRFSYYAAVLEAVLRHARTYPFLRFRIVENSPEQMLAYEDLPEIHGVFAPMLSEAHLEWFRSRNIPVLYFSSRPGADDLPADMGWICADDVAIGAMAANHFQKMGLSHVAYFGLRSLEYSVRRERGFRKQWTEFNGGDRGIRVCQEGNQALESWLKALPTPCGIFCAEDHHARSLVKEAMRLGYQVPKDFAVIGVDHDLLNTELSPVRLSSVMPDADVVGRKSVEAMAKQLEEGIPLGEFRETIPPTGIYYDESAPYYYSVEPTVTQVLKWMEVHLAEPLQMEDAARTAGLSRRKMEYLFKKYVGCSPYQQVLKMRIDKAKRQLRETTHSMQEIAESCGFTNAREFSVRFKSKLGVPPRVYREQQG